MDKILYDRNANLALSAAAGAGKTRILSLRFLDIYLKYQNLNSIYALTFTNKAAQEMRDRIVKYIDILTDKKDFSKSSIEDSAREEEKEILQAFKPRFKNIKKIASSAKYNLISNFADLNISTIHSFLNSILKTIPFQTPVMPGFRVIEEIEKIAILDKVLDEFLIQVLNNPDKHAVINNILDPKNQNIKTSIKKLFLSLLPKLAEIRGIKISIEKGELKPKTIDKKLHQSFLSFKETSSKILDVLKAYSSYSSKFLDNKLEKIENKLNHGKCEKLAEETVDLLSKKYFFDFKEKLKANQEDNAFREIENLTKLLKKQIEEYSFLNNRKLLTHNLGLFFDIYEKFQNHKLDMNVATFNDLETYALDVFSNEQMKEYLYFKSSSQLTHLLIDEFQDTSILQWKVLEPIIEEITAGANHSFFYVGDPNQAIYRFRGGESRLFHHIPERFPGKIQTEYLMENYRSKKEIVDFVNNVFSACPLYKPMESAQTLKKSKPCSVQEEKGWVFVEELGEYTQKEGMAAVQSRLPEIIQNLKAKGYQYSDMAVLVRKNETGAKLSKTLEEKGIPTKTESRDNLIYQHEIQDIVNLLKWVINPFEDFYLSLALLSPLFAMKETTIENLKRKKLSLFEILKKNHTNWQVTKKLKKILDASNSKTPYELLSYIYSELEVTQKYRHANAFLSLLESAYKFESENMTSLSSFIEYLKQYGSNEGLTQSEMEGVQILTCHKAKGLEFPVVIMPETVWNTEGKENDNFIFEYSESAHELKLNDVYYRKDPLLKIFRKDLFQNEKSRIFQDELNNLYVAMTRAKEGLWIIGYKNMRLSNTWFEFITKADLINLKNGCYSVGEIPVREKLEEKKSKSSKTSKVSPQTKKFTAENANKRMLTPTEEASAVLSEEVREGLKWGKIYHYALSKIKWLDKKNFKKTIDDSIDYTIRIYAQNKEEEREIAKNLNRILEDIATDKELDFIFYKKGKEQFKTEVPIYFKKSKSEILGRIDRLIIRDKSLEIIDYKKGKQENNYKEGQNLKDKYIKQIRMYKEGASKIYPEKYIRCHIVWLDSPKGERIEEIV